MSALYNEIEPYAADWLRNLAERGLIARGEVDERDIRDLRASDLAGYRQCHFFAGIGGWSHALRLAGWPDECLVWTGSCPCQPFSSAGRGGGFADERHLWPDWFRLIRECRPSVIFGEQVASPPGLAWLDLVSADLEGAGYAVGASDLCAAGVGAPHIRQRLYFVAVADGLARGLYVPAREARQTDAEALGRGEAGELGDPGRSGGGRDAGAISRAQGEGDSGRSAPGCVPDLSLSASVALSLGSLGDSRGEGLAGRSGEREDDDAQRAAAERAGGAARATAGFWAGCYWVPCTDGKARPVEPGTFPLASGVPNRVGKLRAYGNAIVPQVAATFIRAFIDAADGVTE